MNKTINALFLAVGMVGAFPIFASTTYTCTDVANNLYSGSFSVSNTLADGTYSFASASSQPAGFTENFFPTYSYVFYGSTVTIAPILTVFDVSIIQGLVSAWDIAATTLPTTLYTRTSNYNVGRSAIITDTTLNTGDFQSVHYINLNSTSTTASPVPGVWSVATVTAVPLPPAIAMFASGLLGLGALRKKIDA